MNIRASAPYSYFVTFKNMAEMHLPIIHTHCTPAAIRLEYPYPQKSTALCLEVTIIKSIYGGVHAQNMYPMTLSVKLIYDHHLINGALLMLMQY